MATMTSPPIGIVWLHGLGDTEEGWAEQLKADWTDILTTGKKVGSVKWKFPRAPEQAVTCNGGMQMTSWFDIEKIPIIPGAKDYPNDIQKACAKVHLCVDELLMEYEKDGLTPQRIFVGGFSQGGATSLLAGLNYSKGPLAGIICFSGWLMTEDTFEAKNPTTPILWWHGNLDNVVTFPLQARGVAKLQEHGITVTARDERYMHSGHPCQEREVPRWILDKLG